MGEVMTGVSEGRPEPGRKGIAPPTHDGGDTVRPLVLTTRGVAKQQQFEVWRDLSVPYLDIGRPLRSAEHGFEARGTALRLGSMMYYHAVLPPYDYSRSQARIRRDSLDHWIIGMCRRGTQRQRSGEFDLAFGTGIPYVLTMARPFEAQRAGAEVEWASLFIARDTAPEFEALLEAALYRPLNGPAGRLLASFIETLQEVAHDLRAIDLAHLETAAGALLAAALDANRDRIEAGRPQIEHLQLTRIRRLIRANLGAATLGPARLCTMGGVSRSVLYRLFEPLGGVARYIQRERLAAAHRLLTDVHERRGIAQMAEAVGFFEPSSFSRAFRAAFGVTPRELRAATLAGHRAAPPTALLDEAHGVASVGDILRRL
jgi:AraC-like DNA-binding protein